MMPPMTWLPGCRTITTDLHRPQWEAVSTMASAQRCQPTVTGVHRQKGPAHRQQHGQPADMTGKLQALHPCP